MKALKILGILVGVLAVAGVVFWLGWLKAPSQEDVCANVTELAKKSDAKTAAKWDTEFCMAKTKPPKFGKMPYVKRMKCMKDAGDFKAAMDCRS